MSSKNGDHFLYPTSQVEVLLLKSPLRGASIKICMYVSNSKYSVSGVTKKPSMPVKYWPPVVPLPDVPLFK